MAGQLVPGHLGDIADQGFALDLLAHGDLLSRQSPVHSDGRYLPPKTGSLCGIGGNAQVPIAGGRTLASTWTSSRQGLLSLIACSSAPSKSSDLVTGKPSQPQARAPPANTALQAIVF